MNNYLQPNKSGQRTILTVYSHTDDEVLPAAGTLHLMSQAGWNVHCLILTDGSHSRSAIKGIRNQAEAASKIVGATYEFYALEEYNLSTQTVIKVTEEALQLWQPDLIITHAPQPEKYRHRNHEVCASAVSNVATLRHIPLWYSAPTVFLPGFEPNFFVDITPVIESKIAAIGCYSSEQTKSFMQLNTLLVISQFWARELGQKDGYYEAFEIDKSCQINLLI